MPAFKQLLDVEIALGVAAPGRVGVGELIDEHELRPTRQHGIEIHLLEHAALVVDLPARDDFEPFEERLCLLAAVRLDDADHYIDPVASRLARARFSIS